VRPSPHGTAATTSLSYQPQMIDDGDCGAIGGMNIARGNRNTRRKPGPATLCPPQILYDQTPGSNPCHRCGKPATNRLSYGAVFHTRLLETFVSLTKSVQVVCPINIILLYTFRSPTWAVLFTHISIHVCVLYILPCLSALV
jgi:hypothetical protein